MVSVFWPQVKLMFSQKRKHFTTFQQLDRLVTARETSPETGYMMRLMMLCSLPRSNPGNQLQYVRRNGPHTLVMTATSSKYKLPYGNLPRLLLAWICTEALRTGKRDLVLGHSMYEFMEKLGVLSSDSAGTHGIRTRLRNQMNRLFHSAVELSQEDDGGEQFVAGRVVDRGELWWDPKRPGEPVLFESTIRLGEEFFNEIIRHPVPLDMNTLKALSRSPLGLDLYLWLTYRTFTLMHPLQLSWTQLYVQFGANPAKAGNRNVVNAFRTDCLRELKKITIAWPALEYATPKGGLEIRPTKPLIKPVAPRLGPPTE